VRIDVASDPSTELRADSETIVLGRAPRERWEAIRAIARRSALDPVERGFYAVETLSPEFLLTICEAQNALYQPSRRSLDVARG
jgi:hypothetical protein